MNGLTHRIWSVVGMLKGFEVGYSTKFKDRLLMQVDDKVYKVTFEEVGSGNIHEFMDDFVKNEEANQNDKSI